MREILFRGKRRDNREWVFGNYYKQTEFYGDKVEPFGIMIITSSESLCYDQALEYYAVSEKTVGQFTGLTDVNGKKIFEGDILKWHANFKTSVVGKVIFECGTFAFEYTDIAHGIDLEWFSFSDDYIAPPEHCMEVIGNIHDNPELLQR